MAQAAEQAPARTAHLLCAVASSLAPSQATFEKSPCSTTAAMTIAPQSNPHIIGYVAVPLWVES